MSTPESNAADFLSVMKLVDSQLPSLFDSFVQTVCDNNVKPVMLDIIAHRDYKVLNLVVKQKCGCTQIWVTDYREGEVVVWRYYNRGGGKLPSCLPPTHTLSATPDGEIHSSIPK